MLAPPLFGENGEQERCISRLAHAKNRLAITKRFCLWSSGGTCRTRAGSRSPFVGGHGSVRRAQPPRRGRGQASQRFPQPPFLLRVNDRNIVVAPPRSGKGNDGQPSGWEIVRTVDIPVELHSGTNTVTISGNTPWAPDIDRVFVR